MRHGQTMSYWAAGRLAADSEGRPDFFESPIVESGREPSQAVSAEQQPFFDH